MSRVSSRTLAGTLLLAALTACSGNDLPTVPAAADGTTADVAPPPPSRQTWTTSSSDGVLLATTNLPDDVEYQSPATATMSLASTFGGTGGLDLMTVMDASGSVGSVGWQQEKDFVSAIAGSTLPNPPDGRTRMGIVEFSSGATLEWSFLNSQVPSTVINKVQSLKWKQGYTYTSAALQVAIQEYQSATVNTGSDHGKLLLLITDGIPAPQTQDPCNPSNPGGNIPTILQALGVKVVIVGVGNFNPNALSCLVQDPVTDIVQVSDFSELSSILDQVNTYVNPTIHDVTLTGTVSSDFDVIGGPNQSETVLINGADGSTAMYDTNTRQVTWTLPAVDRRTRNITLDLQRSLSATPVCGDDVTAVSNLSMTYTDPDGNTQTQAIGDMTLNVTGCPAPVVTPTVTGTQGDNGWYTDDVTVHWDVQSVEAVTATGCDDTTIASDTDGTDVTCTAASAAGTTAVTVTVKRDATPPEVAFAGNAASYSYGQDIDITCSATDATSGLASSTCPEIHAPASSFSEGTHTLDATATDNAGNTSTAQISFEVVQDHTPPVITPTVSGAQGDNGWYVGDVTVSWSVVDDESAISAESGCDVVTITTDTGGTTFTCSATSAGGSDSQSVTVTRDATPPTVAYVGNAGSYGASQDVNILCVAADNLSGVASSTCADVAEPAWSLGLGTHAYSATATDNAGNNGSGSTSFTVTVSTDDIIALVNAWVSGPGAPGVRNSLAAKLRGPRASVSAFINEVQAQSGKKIPADKAAILIALAQAL